MNNRKKKKKGKNQEKKHKNMQNISQDPEDPEKLISPHQQTMGRIRCSLRSILFKPLRGLDCLISGLFWLQLTAYRFVSRKEYPLFLNGKSVLNAQITDLTREKESLKNKNTRLDGLIHQCHSEIEELKYQLAKQEKSTEKERADVRNLNECLQELSKKIEDMKESNRKLKEEKTSLEKEKEDALRRLSELVSVRLRDNNPNIVDLNDPWRPTKLAEMFSELYDNEWTSAYAVLEGRFNETQAIVILLDTVMEAYEFCEDRMEERWNSLEKWFIDSELPGAQQTCKWLKDSRKATILKKLKEIDADFEELIHKMCKDKEIEKLMSDNTVKGYITKCVELCLLMVTTDPPVILGCPYWEPSKKLSDAEGDEANIDDNGKQDEGDVNEKKSNGDVNAEHNEMKIDTNRDNASSTITVIDEKHSLQKEREAESEDTVTGTSAEQVTDNNEVVNNGCQSGTNEPESGIANGTANEPANEPTGQKSLVPVIQTKRSPFEKETFKEYTTRGKYLDFIVWPALYLHKDGPLLAKGIAQGSKEEFNRPGTTSWIWRRKLPSDVE